MLGLCISAYGHTARKIRGRAFFVFLVFNSFHSKATNLDVDQLGSPRICC